MYVEQVTKCRIDSGVKHIIYVREQKARERNDVRRNGTVQRAM